MAPSRTPQWALLRPVLEPDERILWLGRPDATRLWSDDEIFVVAVYLAWSAFALFMEIMVTLHGAPLFFRAGAVCTCLVASTLRLADRH